MSISKPFHRNYRSIKQSSNSGYSKWGYIVDKEYAKSPEHYIRAYKIIQSDLEKIFEYIEPGPESETTFSYRVHELLMRTCIEFEANFKAILFENTFTPKFYSNGNPKLNMSVYKKINKTHRLSSYEVSLPIWNGPPHIFRPFEEWNTGNSLSWYRAYNISKHSRQDDFKEANMKNLVLAISGLLATLSSQFCTEEFSAGQTGLAVEAGDNWHDMSPAIGSLFMIKFPDNWNEEEMYDFDWSILKKDPNRFEKIDYNKL